MPPILGPDRVITRKEVRGTIARSFLVTRRKVIYPYFVQPIDSFSIKDFFATIGTPPQLDPTDPVAELAGPPPQYDFVEFDQEWTNKLYKSMYYIGRPMFEADQIGQVFSLLNSSAARLANFPDKLFFNRLSNFTGTTYGSCYDGKALFATDHTLKRSGYTSYSNLLTGSQFDSSTWSGTNKDAMAQRFINDFIDARSRMLAFKDDHGEPFHQNTLDPNNLVVLVPPLMLDVARYAFNSERIAATSNVMRGQVKAVITSNYLPATATDSEAFDWYLFYTGERVRPIIYSRFRRRTSNEMQDGVLDAVKKVEGFDNVKMNDLKELSTAMVETNIGAQGSQAQSDVAMNERFFVSLRWRGEMIPGEWRNVVKVNNAASS